LSLSVHEYWEGHLAALSKRSVHVQEETGVTVQSLSGRGGIIDSRLWFDDAAYLDVYEHVEIDGWGTPHRRRYSYHLEVDGVSLVRHDFDPNIEDTQLQHHVNIVRSGSVVLHVPSERITLAHLVDQCWGLIEEHRGAFDE